MVSFWAHNSISLIGLSISMLILNYLNYYSFIKILDQCFFYFWFVMTILGLFVLPYKFLNHTAKLHMHTHTHTYTHTSLLGFGFGIAWNLYFNLKWVDITIILSFSIHSYSVSLNLSV